MPAPGKKKKDDPSPISPVNDADLQERVFRDLPHDAERAARLSRDDSDYDDEAAA